MPRRFPAALTAALVASTLLGPVADAGPIEDLTTNPWLGAGGDDGFLNIAHRGGGAEFPEHTRYAYAESLPTGVEMLEADVYMTLDRQLVVLHDATVDRTTDGTGAVSSMTVAELKALDNAYWFCPAAVDCETTGYPFRGMATGDVDPEAGYSAEDFRIMTLDEALAAFPDVPFTIELKPNPQDTGVFEAELARVLAEHDRTDDVIVASFIDTHLELFKAAAPDVSTSFPTGQAAAFSASSFGPLPGAPNRHHALQVPKSLGIEVVTADYVADAHANGLAVHVWTINDCATMVELLDLGVDGIMTDVPSRLQAVLDARETSDTVDCSDIA